MNEMMNIMKKHLQKMQRLKCQIKKQRKKIFKNVYNLILLNSVSNIYHIMINILKSQKQFIFSIIINQLLKELKKYKEKLENFNEKIKVMLFNKSKSKKMKNQRKKR